MMNNLDSEMFFGLILALGGFLLSMFLTPIYTYFAYKYKFWKKQKKETLNGEALPVMTKLHAHKFKRAFPTMAGVVGLIAVLVVTFCCNFNREWTWLPLAGFLGGGIIGLIDDAINIFGTGKGVAGLRAPVKMTLITLVGLLGGWYFAVKLGMVEIQVPFVGMMSLGVVVVSVVVVVVTVVVVVSVVVVVVTVVVVVVSVVVVVVSVVGGLSDDSL